MNAATKPYCEGGIGTCEVCVGSCGIEEYEAANAATTRVFLWSYHEWIGVRPEAEPPEGFVAQEDRDAVIEIPSALYERFVVWEREYEALQRELKDYDCG